MKTFAFLTLLVVATGATPLKEDNAIPPPPEPVANSTEVPAPLPTPVGNHTDVPSPLPPPVPGQGNTVQNVKASASPTKGTAVVSAVAKRAAVVQNLSGSGNKAIVTGESHKGADQNIQKLEAVGGEVGIASAVVDKKNATAVDPKTGKPAGPEVTLQNVKASGNKAVATAENSKGSGNTVQEAAADGEEVAIATVTSS